MKGPLAEGVLPALLRDLYVGRMTGRLHFTHAQQRLSLRFRHGHMIQADSNIDAFRLGETLVRHRLLSQADLDLATGIVLRDHKRLGIVLQELGLLARDGLAEALAVQLREILAQLFDWSTGEYAFEPHEAEASLEGDVTLKLSTGEMILEAVRRVADPLVVHRALGDTRRVLSPSNDPLLRFQKITLSPADGFVLSRVDGTTSAQEVMEMVPLPTEQSERSLLALLSTGVIEFTAPAKPPSSPGFARPQGVVDPARTPVRQPPPPSVAPPPPVVAKPPSPPPGVALPSAPAVATAPRAAAQPAAPAAPAAPPPTVDRAALRQDVLDAYDGVKTRSHFEVLGIQRTAGEAQVKEAYFRQARRFHPDSHHDDTLADLRAKLEAVFMRVGEAYETLRNPRARAIYEETLAAHEAHAAMIAAGVQEDPAEGARRAFEAFRVAEKLLAADKYFDVVQLLEPVVEQAEPRIRQRIRLLLARTYLKNPRWKQRAEVTLQDATRDNPRDFESWFALAEIYRAGGLRGRALKAYERVLELKPEHEAALLAVTALRDELTPSPPESRGLFKKLFGGG